MRVLIFEDEKMLADMYVTKFKMSGFDAVSYESPTTDPVSIILKEKPDLILSGIIMPKMDGFGAAKIYKADPRTKEIPLVFLTNLGQKEDIEKGLSLGAVDYLVKANNTPAEIIERICRILNLPKPTFDHLDPDMKPDVHPAVSNTPISKPLSPCPERCCTGWLVSRFLVQPWFYAGYFHNLQTEFVIRHERRRDGA